MKLANFTISKDTIGVVTGGRYLDLHNNFNLQFVTYDVTNAEVVLRWSKGAGAWIPESDPQSIVLRLQGVTRFRVSERDERFAATDDLCVNNIGFLPIDVWDQLEYGGFCEMTSETDYLMVDLVSGTAFKITADSARVEVE